MASKLLRRTRIQLLLALNAVAILVAGILIAGAIGLTGGFKAVDEHSDEIEGEETAMELIETASEEIETPVPTVTSVASGGSGRVASGGGWAYTAANLSGGNVGPTELWSVDKVTIYQTADIDICINDALPGYDNMYWQTSNTGVIRGFYAKARTYLGYSSAKCRYPVIVGAGTTTITAGTYDGTRRDTLEVTVLAPPVDQWKQEVLRLVNAERAKVGAPAVSWGYTCEGAATLRATEIKTTYSHTRPDGSAWHTACPVPATGGKSGENLAAGSAVVSPRTVVAAWMASVEHRTTMLDAAFTKLAVGFVFDPATQHKTYWSQIFSTY